MTAKRLIITGRVQGVGFRDWMVSRAQALGVSGWVRNRRDGTIVTGNQASRRMVGRGARELIGRHFSVHVAPHEVQRVANLHARLIETEEPQAFETQFLHADGSPIDVAVRLMPARLRGRLVGVLGIAADLTAQHRSERALVAARERFASFFEAHPDPAFMISADGTCIAANRAACLLTGFASGELAGVPATSLAPQASAELTRALALAANGETARCSIVLRAKDGRPIDVRVTTLPMLAGGRNDGLFCICRR